MQSSPEDAMAVDARHVTKTKTTTPNTASTDSAAMDSNPACSSAFLKLPAELRNTIYELVASDQDVLRLSVDLKIVLPPFGRTCKQIRTEMRDIFESVIVSQPALVIVACAISSKCGTIYDWVEDNVLSPTGRGRGGFCMLRTYVQGSDGYRIHGLGDIVTRRFGSRAR